MGSLFDGFHREQEREVVPTPAFVTGSHIYGTPGPESDIDLVVLCNAKTKAKLLEEAGGKYPIRFGKLNVIVASSQEEYKAWADAKARCLEFARGKGRQLTKEEAVTIHDLVRVEHGVEYTGGSGKKDVE